jgi:hypothetical protein
MRKLVTISSIGLIPTVLSPLSSMDYEMESSLSKYLAPTGYIQADAPEIVETTRGWIANAESETEKAAMIEKRSDNNLYSGQWIRPLTPLPDTLLRRQA